MPRRTLDRSSTETQPGPTASKRTTLLIPPINRSLWQTSHARPSGSFHITADLTSSAMASNTTGGCIPATPLEQSPILRNVSYIAVMSQDALDPAITACCAPNPVSLVDNCYVWCQIPQSYLNGTSQSDSSETVIANAFGMCLGKHGTRAGISVDVKKSGGGTATSRGGVQRLLIAGAATTLAFMFLF